MKKKLNIFKKSLWLIIKCLDIQYIYIFGFFFKFRSNILFSAQYSGNEVTITNLLTFFENPCTVNREEKSELDN